MNQKAQVILLQIIKALQQNKWTTDNQWQLSLKADGYVPLMRSVVVQGSLDGDKWQDQIYTIIRLKITTDDEITFFPEFSLYAQIAIGEIPAKDIEIQMMGNVAFTDKDMTDSKKFISAAREINRMVDNHLDESYQDYINVNEQFVKFYKQMNSQEKSSET
jgi:hypothetical protein